MRDWAVAKAASLMAATPSQELAPGWRLGAGEQGSSFLLRLRRRLWFGARTPFTIRWLNNVWLRLYPDNEICRGIFLTGVYEPNEFGLLDRILRSGMAFLDVGANMGLYTLFAARKVGADGVAIAIEPSKREFLRLRTNVELNSLPNARLLRIAASDCTGEAELLVATEEKSGHNTLGEFGYESVVPLTRESVKVERLDAIVQRERLSRVDVIKMDIEGAELLALKGATDTLTRFRPIVLMELSDRTLNRQGFSSGEVLGFLALNGYRVFAFARDTGLPVPVAGKSYFDAENIVAIHASASDSWL